jgi:NAD(P)-dependent dehydrogenase (short-subunit alcohol dehydrogenase family)
MGRILITGATRGIGRALVDLAAGRGHEVLACGRDADALAALPGTPVVADLAHPETLAAAVAGIDRLDALVHCAGMVRLGPVADTPYATWAEHLTVNLAAPAELTRALLPALRAARGRVVFVNSGAGLRASPDWSAYAASKHGLRALADSLRAEEAGNGVRVSSVFPGRTATDMQRGVRAAEGSEYREAEYLRPETVAGAVLTALEAPDDAHLTDLVLRPMGG